MLTSRLNQDPIENLFSVIRHKGAQRDNPDASQFRAAFRQCMVDSVMAPGKNANCAEDVDKFLLTLKNIHSPTPIPAIPIQRRPIGENLPESVRTILAVCSVPPPEEGLSDPETNILAYIGGYIVRKLRRKNVLCAPCDEKISSEINEEDVHHQFLVNKNIKEAKTGLSAPSNDLLGVLQQIELEYNKIIDECMVRKEAVRATLVATLIENVKLMAVKCDTCHMEKLVVHLMANIRLHHTIKITNKNLRENKDRKKRKVVKFSHL